MVSAWSSRKPRDWGDEIVEGEIPGHSVVHKFGATIGVSSATVYKPITVGEIYNTPQVASATTLRVKAGNTNDTAAGSGAREVTLIGLDETGAEITVTVATNGTSASTATDETFLRLYRVYVSASGTYSSIAGTSHAANIVIENGAGGTDWATILVTNFGRAQSQIGMYTVPLGKKALIQNFTLTAESLKPVDFILFQRRDILQTAVPYSAMRVILELFGLTESFNSEEGIPFGPYPALTDLGFMARGANTPDVTVDFEMVLEDV